MSYTKARNLRPQPLTAEEKNEHILRALAQKRESFATGILFNLCQTKKGASLPPKVLAQRAVDTADALMEILFPIPENTPDAKE